MSETKRVTLNTISSTVSSSLTTAGSSLRFGADFLAQTEKSSTPAAAASSSGNKGVIKSIRLNVALFQTDSKKCPEFNYTKLLHVEKKKIKKLKQKSSNGFSDPFEDNDDDVARIAKELEKKYGNAYSTGRSKNKRDDVDIGMGYDESDSFIDNTEAYDELIPDEVETVEGGFYINCGALEFKKLHTESMTTKTDELIKMPNRPKKRAISSSSEESSSSSDEDDDDSDDDDEDDDSVEESTSVETAKSKSSTIAATTDKKTKTSSASTTNPTKKKVISTENGGATAAAAKKTKDKNQTSGLSLSASNSPKPTAEVLLSDMEKNAKKVEKTTTVKDMLKAQRDNFLKSQTSNGDVKGKSSAEDEEDDDDESSSDDSDDEDDSDDNSDSNQSVPQTQKEKKPASGNEDNQGNEKLRTADTNLPELEADVLASIVEFKDIIKSRNMTGKKFQFNDKLSETFLKIDDSLLCLDKTQRNMVFAHLEYQLSLPKYYFLRKAKQLRIKEEKLKSKRAFSKLHKAITETMPAVIASYDAELRRFAELQAASLNSDQPPKMPKKKFPWNANIRNLLYEVYQVRWTSYLVLKTRKETLEEFITSYMRDKVVEIWPKGWMRYEELQKEIEKRKTAAKKAKERKKIASAATSGQSSPNPNVSANPTATIQISSVSSLAVATGTTTLPNSAQSVSFIKQFEDFATRSNANSDTESVASNSTSSGLKRKNTDAVRNKPTKPKAAKLNGEQTKTSNNKKNMPPVISVDLSSPTRRTDHSINHIMSPTGGTAAATSTTTSTSNSIFSATTAAVSQPSSKHSSNTHVIDLENYKSVSDILQTSKQLQAAANAAASSSLLTSKTNAGSRRESSGDSEIEFIGVIPAKIQNKKTKTNSRSGTPNSNYAVNDKSTSHNHNINNNNNNNSKKKSANSGITNLPAMDVNKMVSALMELGDELQIKPILTSTAQQQQNSQASTMSQSGGGSLQ